MHVPGGPRERRRGLETHGQPLPLLRAGASAHAGVHHLLALHAHHAAHGHATGPHRPRRHAETIREAYAAVPHHTAAHIHAP